MLKQGSVSASPTHLVVNVAAVGEGSTASPAASSVIATVSLRRVMTTADATLVWSIVEETIVNSRSSTKCSFAPLNPRAGVNMAIMGTQRRVPPLDAARVCAQVAPAVATSTAPHVV